MRRYFVLVSGVQHVVRLVGPQLAWGPLGNKALIPPRLPPVVDANSHLYTPTRVASGSDMVPLHAIHCEISIRQFLIALVYSLEMMRLGTWPKVRFSSDNMVEAFVVKKSRIGSRRESQSCFFLHEAYIFTSSTFPTLKKRFPK